MFTVSIAFFIKKLDMDNPFWELFARFFLSMRMPEIEILSRKPALVDSHLNRFLILTLHIYIHGSVCI